MNKWSNRKSTKKSPDTKSIGTFRAVDAAL